MVVDASTSAELQMKAAPCSVTMNAWGQSPAGRECWCWQSAATAGPLTEVNTIDTVPSLIFRCGGTISITTPPHLSNSYMVSAFPEVLTLPCVYTDIIITCYLIWFHPFPCYLMLDFPVLFILVSSFSIIHILVSPFPLLIADSLCANLSNVSYYIIFWCQLFRIEFIFPSPLYEGPPLVV